MGISARIIVFLSLLGMVGAATSQDVPLISGSLAYVTNTTGGKTTHIPLIQPLAAVPLGEHFLLESRALVLEESIQNSTGYSHSHFAALAYLQGDFIATPRLTVVAGSYLLPFGTYNERLTPVWIGNFQDESPAEPIGQMGSGIGLGGQVRGSLFSNAHSSFSYSAWYSARSGNQQFSSERSSGGGEEASTSRSIGWNWVGPTDASCKARMKTSRECTFGGRPGRGDSDCARRQCGASTRTVIGSRQTTGPWAMTLVRLVSCGDLNHFSGCSRPSASTMLRVTGYLP